MKAEERRDKEKRASVEKETLFQWPYLTVERDIFAIDGKKCTWVKALLPGAVAVLPVMADGRLLLIRQWRRTVGEILTEIPAGMLEKGEDPLSCAQRELQEETGFFAGTLTPLCYIHTSPGVCNEKLLIVLAKDLLEKPLPPDEDEAIDLLPLSLGEAMKMIEEGKITDAKTIIALYRYHHFL